MDRGDFGAVFGDFWGSSGAQILGFGHSKIAKVFLHPFRRWSSNLVQVLNGFDPWPYIEL